MKKTLFRHVKERLKDKATVIIIAVYALLCIGSGIYLCFNEQFKEIGMCFGFLLFIPLYFIVEYVVKIRFGAIFTVAVFCQAFGAILGSCFNFYERIPFFDVILHTLAGILFAALGYSIANAFFGKEKGSKNFFGKLLFAVFFSLSVALLWELFEFVWSSTFGFDMQVDSIVTEIKSYFLAGVHTEVVTIDNITKTLIYYGNGQVYEINGYLDIGLLDTMWDMLVCLIGAITFALISVFSHYKCPKINEMFVPQGVNELKATDENTQE